MLVSTSQTGGGLLYSLGVKGGGSQAAFTFIYNNCIPSIVLSDSVTNVIAIYQEITSRLLAVVSSVVFAMLLHTSCSIAVVLTIRSPQAASNFPIPDFTQLWSRWDAKLITEH